MEADPPLPAKEDSAWGGYESLPQRAREAAKLASLAGNHITKLLEEIVSKKQAKEMIHGPDSLFTQNGTTLRLTELGGSVAAIHRAAKGNVREAANLSFPSGHPPPVAWSGPDPLPAREAPSSPALSSSRP